MKYYGMILEFRKSYRKLDYFGRGMTVSELCIWVQGWCNEKGIAGNLYYDFKQLALAYVERDFHERAIERELRKINFPL